jgi:hypothetical protein
MGQDLGTKMNEWVKAKLTRSVFLQVSTRHPYDVPSFWTPTHSCQFFEMWSAFRSIKYHELLQRKIRLLGLPRQLILRGKHHPGRLWCQCEFNSWRIVYNVHANHDSFQKEKKKHPHVGCRYECVFLYILFPFYISLPYLGALHLCTLISLFFISMRSPSVFLFVPMFLFLLTIL